jgi:hypothetical protein
MGTRPVMHEDLNHVSCIVNILFLVTWTAEYEGRSRRETPLRRAMFA